MAVQLDAQATFPAGNRPQAIASLDVNGDGIPDLVVADESSLGVLIGDGHGGLGPPNYSPSGASFTSLATLDANGDGLTDIVGVSRFDDDIVSILLNNGQGGFTAGARYAVGKIPTSVVTADVNGDGLPDLVVANTGEASVSVLLNNGHGGFGPKTDFAIPTKPTIYSPPMLFPVAVADMNGDGKPDLIVGNYQDKVVNVLLGNGQGGFGTPIPYAVGLHPTGLAVADLNGDGRPDIAVGDEDAASTAVLLANSNGGFDAPATYVTPPGGLIVTADLNGDNRPDLVLVGGGLSVLTNDGNGGFGTTKMYLPSFATGTAPTGLLATDLNEDGRPDIVVANLLSNNVSVLLNAEPAKIATLRGAHTDYAVTVTPDGAAIVTDSVPGRDGTQTLTLTGGQDLVFTDGVGRVDATGNAEEVARLYKAAFNRTADEPGLNDWTARIDSGSVNLQNVAGGFINSPEFNQRYGSLSHQALLQQLYLNVLGRPGDAAGVAQWTGALDGSASVGQVLLGFSDSLENKDATRAAIGDKDEAEAARLYPALNRAPDAAGLHGWTSALDGGASELSVASGFVQSTEFDASYGGLSASGYVAALYRNVLHRPGDPAGIVGWTNALQGGATRASVLLGFSDSTESRIATAGSTHDGWVFLPKT